MSSSFYYERKGDSEKKMNTVQPKLQIEHCGCFVEDCRGARTAGGQVRDTAVLQVKDDEGQGGGHGGGEKGLGPESILKFRSPYSVKREQ